MTKITSFLFLLTLTVADARAAQLFYEPFDYANVGSPVTDNEPANWVYGGSGVDDTLVTAGSLSFPGLKPSVGNSISNGGAGIAVRRLLGGTALFSGTAYFSILFNMNVIGSAWTAPNASVGALTETNNTGFKVSILLNRNFDSTGYVFGLQKGGAGTTPSQDVTSYFEGQTVLLVGSYAFDDINPDVISLWINPDPSTFGLPTPPAATLTANTGTDSTVGLDRFNFRQNAATGANSLPETMQWDELRIGETWADVTPAAVPESSSAVLLVLGAAGLLFRRASRRE